MPGGVEVIERIIAIKTPVATNDQPVFGFANTEFQSAAAKAPKPATRAAAIYVRYPINMMNLPFGLGYGYNLFIQTGDLKFTYLKGLEN